VTHFKDLVAMLRENPYLNRNLILDYGFLVEILCLEINLKQKSNSLTVGEKFFE
jgi:hypothetical protein